MDETAAANTYRYSKVFTTLSAKTTKEYVSSPSLYCLYFLTKFVMLFHHKLKLSTFFALSNFSLGLGKKLLCMGKMMKANWH
jgi:hypothetical protein